MAESEALSVPVTLGVARPVILLPVDWREWDSDKLNAVLAHELSHIGRNDALTQRLAKLHRAIYWFSPLPWWLDRQLARLAEEASDEAALASGADRERYAETLLRFFEAIRAASGRVWWQGVSMAAGGDAAKRVDRILSWKGVVTMRLRKPLAAMLAAAALPMLFAVAAIHFTASAAQQAPKPHVAPVPALPPLPGLAPVPQLAPAPALAPMPAPTAVLGAVAVSSSGNRDRFSSGVAINATRMAGSASGRFRTGIRFHGAAAAEREHFRRGSRRAGISSRDFDAPCARAAIAIRECGHLRDGR